MLEGHEAEDGDEGDGEGKEGQEPGAEELVEGDVEGEVVGVVGFLLLARGREEGRGLAWFLLLQQLCHDCLLFSSIYAPTTCQPTNSFALLEKKTKKRRK